MPKNCSGQDFEGNKSKRLNSTDRKLLVIILLISIVLKQGLLLRLMEGNITVVTDRKRIGKETLIWQELE